ncbi:MAG TPA: type II secretion system protein [Pyrinomonadaceae bacterium]|nr:type II secretion system protein [Pyrinomonadaceae bacterium]
MCKLQNDNGSRGFTLIELVVTLTVLTILTMGVVPLLKISVKRQKEQQLHDVLRQMRTAIDEFHRDTVGINCTGSIATTGGNGPLPSYLDPRSKVVISDCTIFGVDNPDRYPPDLETLVSGVNVLPRGGPQGGQGLQSTGTATTNTNSVLGSQNSTKTKVYLRQIPIDPMTGKADWEFRSCYDAGDSGSWGGENVFDVRSKSKDTALNGEKYSDW